MTLSTTHRPATDLGYLLHKNPARAHRADLSFGTAHVLYPEATEDRCSAAVVVEVDPVGLVRDRRRPAGSDFQLAPYVNDRSYAASSFLSVAIGKLFGTAMSGRSKDRPDLAGTAIPIEIGLPVVPLWGGEALLAGLFEPLGYQVSSWPIPLDPAFPAWGDSPYRRVQLAGRLRVQEALEHLYVLLPVLDDEKHYWVGPDEVDKLLRRGGAWLGSHPERSTIAQRYLRHDRLLTRDALARLSEEGGDQDGADAASDAEEQAVEREIGLGEQRIASVVAAVEAAGARRVGDLGCGDGKLVEALLRRTSVAHVLAVDVSVRALQLAARRLDLETMAPAQRQRVELAQGSLVYRDSRLSGLDLAAVVEVVEHLDPWRLDGFERVLFGEARPKTVVVTTPNREHNRRFPGLPAGSLRHRDHRFEWTRAELAAWAGGVGERRGYRVELSGVGPVDEELGAPSQMAVFRR